MAWRAQKTEGWETRLDSVEQQLGGAEHSLRFAWGYLGRDYDISSIWTAPPEVICPGDTFAYHQELVNSAPSDYVNAVTSLKFWPAGLGEVSGCEGYTPAFYLQGDSGGLTNDCEAAFSQAVDLSSGAEMVGMVAETNWMGPDGITVLVKYLYGMTPTGDGALAPATAAEAEVAETEAAEVADTEAAGSTPEAEVEAETPGAEATAEAAGTEAPGETPEAEAAAETPGAEAAAEAAGPATPGETPEAESVAGGEAGTPVAPAATATPEAVAIVADADADGDGLSDQEEALIGTDPLDPNSDGDEMRDGAEVDAGRDPLDLSDGLAQEDDLAPLADPCEGLDEGVWLVVGAGKALQGRTVRIPVSLCHAEGLGDLNATIVFDPEVLRSTAVMGGAFLGEALFDANTEPQGTIELGIAYAEGLSGDGFLGYLGFDVMGDPGSTALLDGQVTAAHALEGGEPVWVAVRDGSFAVEREGLKGDWNNDLRVNSVDALAALRMSIGKIPPDLILDMNDDGRVTALDARWILEVALGSREM